MAKAPTEMNSDSISAGWKVVVPHLTCENMHMHSKRKYEVNTSLPAEMATNTLDTRTAPGIRRRPHQNTTMGKNTTPPTPLATHLTGLGTIGAGT